MSEHPSALSSWRIPAALAVLAFAVAVVAATSVSAGAAGVPQIGDGVPAADVPAASPHDAVVRWPSPLPDLVDGSHEDLDAGIWQPLTAAAVEPEAARAGGPGGEPADPQTADPQTADPQTADPQAADPIGLRIPDLDVASGMVPLAVDDAGSIEVPADPAQAGWWVAGPEPGERGAAVVLGHVDSWQGPGVFYGLQALGRGDPVLIDRADGTTVVYAVTEAALYTKADFPSERVYDSDGDGRLLRLVTCGGSFDTTAGSYASNYVVFAEQVDVIPTAGPPDRPDGG